MLNNIKWSSNLIRFSSESDYTSNRLQLWILNRSITLHQVLHLRPRIGPGAFRVSEELLVPRASDSQQTGGPDGHELRGSREAFDCLHITRRLGAQCLVYVGVWGHHPTSTVFVCLQLLHALGAQFRGGFRDAWLVEEIVDGQETCPKIWQDAEGWAVDICAPAARGVNCGRLCDISQVGACTVEVPLQEPRIFFCKEYEHASFKSK